MSVRYDDKGKYFTDVITKDPVPSIVQTLVSRIQGNLHVRISDRVTDELNRDEKFLALTDAKIFDLSGQKIYDADFMLVNSDQVIWILPDEKNIARTPKSEGEV
jgi:hypothetical protein